MIFCIGMKKETACSCALIFDYVMGWKWKIMASQILRSRNEIKSNECLLEAEAAIIFKYSFYILKAKHLRFQIREISHVLIS
jgi:hypothetical protein